MATPNTESIAAEAEEFHEPTRGERLDNIARLERALLATLTDDQHQLLHAFREAQEHYAYEDHMGTLERLVDGLARHFPGFEPAIRALALHSWDEAAKLDQERRTCSLVRDDPPGMFNTSCDAGDDETDGAA